VAVTQSALAGLDLTNPVLAAPMAGGASTPELVIAAAAAGSLGFLAAGYKNPDDLAGQIRSVRQRTPRFGVNVFVPNPVPVDPAEFRRYAAALQPDAAEYKLDLTGAEPMEDDDWWAEKIDLLLADPVPVVSFTFGVPDAAVIRRLRQAGTVTIQTVTSGAEARVAVAAGVDALAVQGYGAGAHSATMTPERFPANVPLTELAAEIGRDTRLPVIAAGGLSTAAEVAAALHAGASAVMVGTVLLRAGESGAAAVHRAALAAADRGDPVLTRAFTGRPARALPNAFIRKHSATAPAGYPAIHYLTSGLRKAATAAGNAELVNLWAGTGYRNATAEPVAAILTRLAREADASAS
jgi:nitronate monooxygenase